ncbi:hypothetical protein GCK72_016328 [Caenorhabditis remanei]|uniref:Uncharacterized protein n=1 Tax=Caenorhabditis remanei TaxID=31234 RepID=A0A6A5GYR3_CAERE|nr:hypothetical protein GCK72_016328 [Caenorhabditis remanei]KAF1759861.1 hypothetical protein GCK72_016328 [Caenorhabditis remanei]
MGQCLSLFKSETSSEEGIEMVPIIKFPIVPPPPRPPQHVVYPPSMAELIRVPAGRLPLIPDDDYVLVEYTRAAREIFANANRLTEKLNKLEECHKESNNEIGNAFTILCIFIDRLAKHYEDFLRLSAFNVDQFAQSRKDMASEGYKALYVMKKEVEVLLKKKKPWFNEIRRKIKSQIKHGNGLWEHVQKAKFRVAIE